MHGLKGTLVNAYYPMALHESLEGPPNKKTRFSQNGVDPEAFHRYGNSHPQPCSFPFELDRCGNLESNVDYFDGFDERHQMDANGPQFLSRNLSNDGHYYSNDIIRSMPNNVIGINSVQPRIHQLNNRAVLSNSLGPQTLNFPNANFLPNGNMKFNQANMLQLSNTNRQPAIVTRPLQSLNAPLAIRTALSPGVNVRISQNSPSPVFNNLNCAVNSQVPSGYSYGPQHVNLPPDQIQQIPSHHMPPQRYMQAQIANQNPLFNESVVMNNNSDIQQRLAVAHSSADLKNNCFANAPPSSTLSCVPTPDTPSTSTPFTHIDQDKCRTIQSQLILLLHAHKCSQREHSENGFSCSVAQCAAMKNILSHMVTCTNGNACEVQHCISSRRLITHWKGCSSSECKVCYPLKSAIVPKNKRTGKEEWHSQITPDIRAHLVTKIVNAIFPTQDENHYKDSRMQSLITYAKRVEAEMYEQADSQDHYFHLLAEKIYKIRKELDERKNERARRQQQLEASAAQNAMNNARGSGDNSAPSHQMTVPVSSQTPQQIKPTIEYRLPYNPDKSAGEEGPPNTIAPSAPMKVESCDNAYNRSALPPHENVIESHKEIKSENKDIENEVQGSQSINERPASSSPEPLKTDGICSVKTEESQQDRSDTPKQETCKSEPYVKTETDSITQRQIIEKEKINSMVLHEIFLSEDSVPFRQPVDPLKLNIPDYFQIVKKPMDLSTIKRKLDDLEYRSPWDFIDDMWLMFQNAWTYNKKTSKIYKMCSRLSELFQPAMNKVMQLLGYCCGTNYVYLPQVLFCYGNQVCSQIQKDTSYYCYTNETPRTNLTGDKYTICSKCYESVKGDYVLVGDDPGQKMVELSKSEFVALRNEHQEPEQFVVCKFCDRKWHQICALHHESIWPEGFVCPGCIKEKSIPPRENRFSAARLPNNKLGAWIENRVNNLLRKNNLAHLIGKIHVRVLASFDKTCDIKPRMKRYFGNKIPDFYPFRTKAIFAFEEIDGVDVAFFGMHVQEYDSKCPSPNQRRVYISYLDSVYFFQPKHLRTDVYHEILIGYLDWVKRLGYQWGHIWACPPSEGDDYIFHCHPPDQKVPKQKRLIEWYKKMLDKAILDRVVLEYRDIMKDATENGIESVLDIPYFDGDFWPNVFEDSIKEIEEDEERKRLEESSENKSCGGESNIDADDSKDANTDSKRCPVKKKKNQSKNKTQRKNCKKFLHGCDLTSKVFATMEKHKEVFFVIRLLDSPSGTDLDEIVDTDAVVSSDLMDGRDAFLNFSREKHYEFSTLRRSKFSSIAFLYELHNQGADKFVYSCNKCKAQVEIRFHCTVCEDFDLCTCCYHKEGHEHKMERLASAIEIADGKDENSDEKAEVNPQVLRQRSIERCIDSLLHAVNCRNANCTNQRCQKMKRIVQHTKQCKNKPTNQCQICKQIIALCCYHAKHCSETNCQFPFCNGLKQKMQKQRALNNQMERRRMMTTMHRSNVQSPTSAIGHGTMQKDNTVSPFHTRMPPNIELTNSVGKPQMLTPGQNMYTRMNPAYQPVISPSLSALQQRAYLNPRIVNIGNNYSNRMIPVNNNELSNFLGKFKSSPIEAHDEMSNCFRSDPHKFLQVYQRSADIRFTNQQQQQYLQQQVWQQQMQQHPVQYQPRPRYMINLDPQRQQPVPMHLQQEQEQPMK